MNNLYVLSTIIRDFLMICLGFVIFFILSTILWIDRQIKNKIAINKAEMPEEMNELI